MNTANQTLESFAETMKLVILIFKKHRHSTKRSGTKDGGSDLGGEPLRGGASGGAASSWGQSRESGEQKLMGG